MVNLSTSHVMHWDVPCGIVLGMLVGNLDGRLHVLHCSLLGIRILLKLQRSLLTLTILIAAVR